MSKIALSGNASGTGTFTIASPNSNSNYQLDLPAESGTVITTASTTGISASALSTGTIPKARMYAGAVLQVLQTAKTDTFSTSSAGWVDVTGLSVSITPSSTSSKILVLATVQGVNQSSTGSTFRLVRDSTAISVATSAGSRTAGSGCEFFTGRADNFLSSSATYLDSPATTSSVTYKIQINGNGYNMYINRSVNDVDNSGYARGVSYITVMEIAG